MQRKSKDNSDVHCARKEYNFSASCPIGRLVFAEFLNLLEHLLKFGTAGFLVRPVVD
jgi:hypothetical protein